MKGNERRSHRHPKTSEFTKAHRCYWCHRVFGEGPLTKTREHLIPRSYGGKFVVAACWACNNARGRDMSWTPGCRVGVVA